MEVSVPSIEKTKRSRAPNYMSSEREMLLNIISDFKQVELTTKKAASVAKLLQTHFGDKWMENEKLKFYKNAVENSTEENQDPNEDSYHEESCSQLEKNDELRITQGLKKLHDVLLCPPNRTVIASYLPAAILIF
ncbi:hypothetical protein NQ318_022819 [Aromia moschata]|uniref:Uncharacterized protein n=1 Tax=Aromia moschata TaxID=1265417 RepID=A0AAV8XKU0_9CUCU|nr:hypothetical protein NQ318_022819 [Aromia moschata]